MFTDRWGVTDQEVARPFPCDDIIRRPKSRLWRGVSIDAPPDRVWPWLSQIRLAPYSYDWIDNGGRRSPRELRGLADPVPGEAFTSTLGRPIGRVLSVEPGRQLTGRIGDVVMSYLLEPDGDGTRLLLKIASPWGWPFAALLSVGDLIMARRQLLNFKHLAERGQSCALDGSSKLQ
ncbi:SRPBCC family protein [Mycobacterium kubicae]|uniref:SRPBCC family protein n=1 Tax=Mycobacterium kubicae TaxID=120959 RepID=UPI0007FCB4E0|nr:SRPBCC family protein [Mycobacterium kubicae]OBK45167.1 polyketide cyclase [Mycobacterium kubicae]